ncbi:MAG: glycoside hydrolase family 2 protein [Saprospiraceae bacterium]|nr:glycoside hydrolase family 2 protein [Saprospiraceae bacterium]
MICRKALMTYMICCIPLLMAAQIHWPPIDHTTRPWTRWWWQGSAVNEKDLTRCMELYQQAGLGGVEITPIYGVAGFENQFIDYLSPRWMEVFAHTLKEGKRLDLGIDMATGTGWPFGGGPGITEIEACKNFEFKRYTLSADQRLRDTIFFVQQPLVRAVGNQIYETQGIYKTEPTKGTIQDPALLPGARIKIEDLVQPISANKNLQALALDQVKFRKRLPLQTLMAYSEDGQSIELTDKVSTDGVLDWTAPQGHWNLYAIFMGWHGKMVERAAPGGEGEVIDHFSIAHLNKYLSRFDQAFGSMDLSGLRAFFNDSYEVDDARGQSNWTEAFFDEFSSRRGYDLKKHLPALLGGGKDEYSLGILYDYRQTIDDLLLDHFTIPWKNWAHNKNKIVRNQSHGAPANILDLYSAIDIPETEGTELLRYKFASSAAHITGKNVVSAEAATWLDEHFVSTLAEVKASVDNYFLGGVNHIVYHGTAYSPKDDPWPGWLFYASVHLQPTNPQWRDFKTLNDYITRCQSFLQQGKSDNHVLLYFPFADRNYQPGRELLHHYDGMQGYDSTVFKKSAELMTSGGYSWDLVSDRQIMDITFADGALHSPGGEYQSLVISGVERMPLNTLLQLDRLIRQGASIILHQSSLHGCGYMDNTTNYGQYKSIVSDWDRIRYKNLYQGDDLIRMLNQGNIRQEGGLYALGLQCVRRAHTSGHYYFIKNTTAQKIAGWVPLHTKAVSASLYDPMTLSAGIANIRRDPDTLKVWLSIDPGSTMIVSTSDQVLSGELYTDYVVSADPVALKGKWVIDFLSGGPSIPASIKSKTLDDWTTMENGALKNFSGSASYKTTFTLPRQKSTHYLLDLGLVHESAEIKINDKYITTCIGPLYQAVISAAALRRKKNKLEVIVSNSMANRIIGLDQNNIPWKKFYNVNMPAKSASNRGADGLFTTKGWSPKSAGLLGPVKLTPLALNKL